MHFPIDLNEYRPSAFNLREAQLSETQRKDLLFNIQMIRDSIVFFTAYANTKGLGGHTGRPPLPRMAASHDIGFRRPRERIQ